MRNYSIISAMLIMSLFSVMISCTSQDEMSLIPSQDEMTVLQSINYLALGDSYTIGQGVAEAERWPNQLSEKLIANDYEILKTDIIAKTGWKTSNLLNAIADTTLGSYDLVSLLIGVNNQYTGQPFEVFTAEFDSLLNIAIELAGGKESVFVLSIPDYGVTPFGSNNSEKIGLEIDMYNDYIRQRCMITEIAFVDVTGISRQLADSVDALAADKLHPSGSQYTQWVDAALPFVLELLTE